MGCSVGDSSWKPICSRTASGSHRLRPLPGCCCCPCSTPRGSATASTPSARSSQSSPAPLPQSTETPLARALPPPPPPDSHSRRARDCPPRCTRTAGRSRRRLRSPCPAALRREGWVDCRCLRAAVKEVVLLRIGYVLVEAGVSAAAASGHAEVQTRFCADIHAHLTQFICVLKIQAFLLPHAPQEGKHPGWGLG